MNKCIIYIGCLFLVYNDYGIKFVVLFGYLYVQVFLNERVEDV